MSAHSRVRIGSAIFNADHGHLADAIVELDRAGIDFFHWDVFDGHFVSELAFCPRTIQAVRGLTSKPFEVHLAVVDAERFIAPLTQAGVDVIFVPGEHTRLLYECVSSVREAGLKAGVSIAVGTPLCTIEEVLCHVAGVLILGRAYGESVANTGYLPQAIRKVESLRAERERRGLTIDIQVAGSLTAETAMKALAAGADSVVFGSALHRADNVAQRLQELRRALDRTSA